MKYLVNLLPHILDQLAKFSTSVSSEIYLLSFEIQISLNSIIQFLKIPQALELFDSFNDWFIECTMFVHWARF